MSGGGSLPYPLSARTIFVRKKRPKTKPSGSTHYIAQIRASDHLGENPYFPPHNPESIFLLSIPNDATPGEVVELVCVRSTFMSRPHREYALVETTADFCVFDGPNGQLQYLTNMDERPLRSLISFPFMLSLVVDPYVRSREECQRRETLRREAQDGQRKRHYAFADEYSTLLLRMHNVTTELTRRQHETFYRLYLLEREDCFNVRREQLLRDEAAARAELADFIMKNLSATYRTMFLEAQEIVARDHIEKTYREEAMWIYQNIHLNGLMDLDRYRRLVATYNAWNRNVQECFSSTLQRMRATYHEQRIHNELLLSVDEPEGDDETYEEDMPSQSLIASPSTAIPTTRPPRPASSVARTPLLGRSLSSLAKTPTPYSNHPHIRPHTAMSSYSTLKGGSHKKEEDDMTARHRLLLKRRIDVGSAWYDRSRRTAKTPPDVVNRELIFGDYFKTCVY